MIAAIDDASGLMHGLPPAADRVVGVHNWSTYPHLRWGFLHTREIVPTARIERGTGPVLPLEPDLRDVAGIAFDWAGARTTVAEMLERTYADGFLVLHGGRVAMEQYGPGMTPATTHLLQSVSKSIAGTVAGVLVGRGLVDPDAPVTAYVDELAGTSFEGATVRHVLDMRTGTAYDETYDDPASDVFLTEVLAGWRPPAGDAAAAHVYEQITRLGNARPHGRVFDYRSILTELLAWVLERASGMRYPELVSEALWSRIGVEQDADITIRHGVTLPDGGVCTTLRDLARFGLMHLREGRAGGEQVVPRATRSASTRTPGPRTSRCTRARCTATSSGCSSATPCTPASASTGRWCGSTCRPTSSACGSRPGRRRWTTSSRATAWRPSRRSRTRWAPDAAGS
jgi:CubicO group peptidase (beta-lactamase class C family)